MTVEDPRLLGVVRYLANRAEQPQPARLVQRYHVAGFGPYSISQEDDPVDVVSTFDDVLYVVYGRVYGRALEPFLDAGWLQVHGGIVQVGSTRVLFVGDKAAGKTTLALRLLFDGFGVEGDELVLTRDGTATSLPRNLHVKEGSLALVPELADHWDDLPATRTASGDVIRAFDPTSAGHPWRIRSGPVDAAVVLEARHSDDAPTARPLSGLELVQLVLPHVSAPSPSRPALLHALTSLVGQVEGHHLQVGPVGPTAAWVAGLGR